MVSIISLVIIISLSILITQIATLALSHTGLSGEEAKFQARSAFTGVGFTTTESEKIVKHPVRRKIVMSLMLIGNIGVISALASVILTFVGNEERVLAWPWRLILLLAAIIGLYLISRSKAAERWINKFINRWLQKYSRLQVRDYAGLLRLSGEYAINELRVNKGDWLCGKTLEESELREEGANLIGIERANGQYIGLPKSTTRIEEGDLLIIYGRESVIRDLDHRKEDQSGKEQHEKAKIEHEVIQTKEDEKATTLSGSE